MAEEFTRDQLMRIAEGIRGKYSKVAVRAEGSFRYPTGRHALEPLKYDMKLVNTLPEEVVASYCGVGNPFLLGPINEGEAVLDIGCGGGVDTLMASMMVGSGGKAVGIEYVPEMLGLARQSLARSGLTNVIFEQGSGETLPFPDGCFDVVVSNGVFNLVPDKSKVVGEVFRVLRPKGRFMIADQVLFGKQPADTASMVDTWAG
jgi:arsenite methyltransferase